MFKYCLRLMLSVLLLSSSFHEHASVKRDRIICYSYYVVTILQDTHETSITVMPIYEITIDEIASSMEIALKAVCFN